MSDQLVLTDEEMAEMATIDKNCRLIKGQVFLWEEASGWEVLWDLDGTHSAIGWPSASITCISIFLAFKSR